MYVQEDISLKPLSVTNLFNQYCKFEIINKRTDNLLNVENFPTHVCSGILDLALTNNQESINSVSDPGNLGNSDHCIINIVGKPCNQNQGFMPTNP